MKNLNKNYISPFLLTFLLWADLSSQPFIDINAGLIGLTVGSAAWGDYDNDGDLDILINGWDGVEEYSIVYRNDNGTFVEINAGLTPAAYGSSVAWGDYDNDGDLDILLSGRIDNVNRVTKVYRNDNGNFIDTNAGLLGLSGSSVAWGDYDNDGDLDILMTGWDGSTRNAKIYRNDDTSFIDINVNIVGVTLGTVAWGDYDNDGDLDILLTGLDNTLFWNSKVYRNDNGIFTDINANLEEVDGSSVAWGDYDNDGDLDIVLAGRTSFGVYSRIYRNDNGNFININANIVDVYESSSVWGDFDNDGDFDLILCGYDYTMNYANIYRNDNGNFVNINAGLIGIQNRNGAAWGDYDNDGDLDILLTGDNGSGFITKIYRNDNTSTNSNPISPSDFYSNQSGLNEITLSWNKSADNETSTNALTYNLRIGTTSGNFDILSPMSDQNTGYRKIPILGNTNHDTSWTVTNLAEGTYYWSVQAIDNSFAGSNFAVEQNFTIVNATLTVGYPNGGEVWFVGETEDILWTSQNVDSVRIELSTDGGTSWTTIIDSIPSSGNYSWIVTASDSSDECLIKISDIQINGIDDISDGYFSIDIITSLENLSSKTIPKDYTLNQNYPNPFNPSTTISFNLPSSGFTSLKIYNALGKEVAILLNKEVQTGNYEIEWNATGLPSGIYFYQLQAGDFIEMKKMILLR